MKQFKGVKGPWVVAGSDIFSEDMDSHVCETSSWFDEDIEMANANLIAAAPDLLEALQEIVEMQNKNYGDGMKTHLDLMDLAKKSKEVISKALGEQS